MSTRWPESYPMDEVVGTDVPRQRLLHAMEVREISGYAICKLTHMPLSTLSGYPTGARKLENMRADTFVRVAQALNVPGEYFFVPDEAEAERMLAEGNAFKLA